MSARLLLVLSLAGILFLDVGRSLYARSAGSESAEPPPSAEGSAQPITWPPGSDLAAGTPIGQRIYAQHCAVCHGPDGKGDGPAAPSLVPRPRDFSGGVFKFKSSASSQPPRRDDVRRSIRLGVAGTSMPAWEDLLSAQEIDAVAEFVRSLGPSAQWAERAAADESLTDVFANADVTRGKALYSDLGCPACHGPQAHGDGPSAPDLRDVWKHSVAARDLTAPWTYRWGTDRAAVYRWIAGGMSGTPMPGYLEVVEPEEIADVVVYLESLARRPPWEGGEVVDITGEPAQRGEYLVRTGMCAKCHTPVDAAGIYQTSTLDLAGGMRIEAGAHGIFFSANLTPDIETGLGERSEAQIAAAIQTGHTRARRLNYWAMPWQVYGVLAPGDALAIAAYLKTLPPVRNAIPDPLYYGWLETVTRKLLYPWPTVPPERLVHASGNFGRLQGGAAERGSTQTWLQRAQWCLLLIAAVAWLLARRHARTEQTHGGASITAALLLFLGAAGVAFVDGYPALGPLPPGPIIGSFAQAIPAVSGDDSARALDERGRYLFAVSSCAFCHAGDGSGGNKVNWSGFGTVWSTNLTAHADGLAAWSDADILRALRSGVRRDGRQMHWQAMPWDFYSNYREEELRSLVAYVRGLPPLESVPHDAVPPGPEDCASYTFWVRDGGDQPGCD